MWKILLISVCSSLLFCSCSGNRTIDGIFVDYGLIYSAEEKYNVDYCDLVKKSINKDTVSVKELVLLNFDAGYSYEHGNILLQIIDKIGEDFFIESLKDISSEQKTNVLAQIKAGVDLRNSINNDFGKRVDEEVKANYPKVYAFLTTDSSQTQRETIRLGRMLWTHSGLYKAIKQDIINKGHVENDVMFTISCENSNDTISSTIIIKAFPKSQFKFRQDLIKYIGYLKLDQYVFLVRDNILETIACKSPLNYALELSGSNAITATDGIKEWNYCLTKNNVSLIRKQLEW